MAPRLGALPDRWRGTRGIIALRWLLLWLVVAALLFGAPAEILFWQEFSTRFNFIAVDYLVYTREVIGNIRESYPVAAARWRHSAALAIVSRGPAPPGARLRRHSDRRARDACCGASSRLRCRAQHRRWPMSTRWNASGNAYADELSGNGLFTFAAALRRNELDYDRFYATLPQERADAILAGLGVEREPLSEALQAGRSVEDPVGAVGARSCAGRATSC